MREGFGVYYIGGPLDQMKEVLSQQPKGDRLLVRSVANLRAVSPSDPIETTDHEYRILRLAENLFVALGPEYRR